MKIKFSTGSADSMLKNNHLHSLLLLGTIFAISAKSWDCNRTWPSLDLFLPVNLNRGTSVVEKRRYYEFEQLFLRSFLLFWPLKVSNTSLNVVIDEELRGTSEHKELVGTLNDFKSRLPGGVTVSYLPLLKDVYRKGYDRQQHAMFWADNFTNREYVGFVDTDCVFYTYIDREDLFEDGKPVVNGRSGKHPSREYWAKMPIGSYRALGIKEPMRCMSYFPVIIKTKHLKEIREYISRYHNKPFDQAFYDISNGTTYYSQFGIMCTFLYTFKRDEYKWYVHTETPSWDGRRPPPNPGQEGNLSIFTPDMYFPKPRVATHARYRGLPFETNIIKSPGNLLALFKRGVCLSPPLDKPSANHTALCRGDKQLKDQGYFEEMFRFEFFDWTKTHRRKKIIGAFQSRQDRLKGCSHDWDEQELKRIMV